MSRTVHDVVVIGGGIVGLATAWALLRRLRGSVAVLEAEPRLASHQSGHNSGVIHSGLYYKPDSLKAHNCTSGRRLLLRYCAERGIDHEICGKVVVATTEAERPRLTELERRGRANGLAGLEQLDLDGLRAIEPHAHGVAALRVPETGIVDFVRVAEALGRDLQEHGGSLHTAARVVRVVPDGTGFVLVTPRSEVRARCLVNCAGLQSDRVARLCGLRPRVRIVPFRGEYFRLVPERGHLVRHLIYPVPDPGFPFLGVHFTRMIGGGVEVGPNALPALAREGYARGSASLRDTFATLSYVGFWRLAARYWRTGVGELGRSLWRPALVRALRRLIPELGDRDLVRHGAGVRAQAVGRDGALLDDFHILESERMLHVLNAPSPAATAALSIGDSLARRAGERFGLAARPAQRAPDVRPEAT